MSTRRALVTGVGGQDGALLARLLLDHGYDVAGIVRRDPGAYADNLGELAAAIEFVRADLLDRESLAEALRATRPDEVYNLAAPSFVPRSWDEPVLTAEFAAVGATSMLEAIRQVDESIRFYQASSSEIFGEPRETPQTEETPPSPVTPYGVAKTYAPLHRVELPPPLRDVHVLRDPLQPRVAAPARRLPPPEGRPRGGGDLARPGARARRSGTSPPAATGAMRATTCARCG